MEFHFDPSFWFICRSCQQGFSHTDELKQHKVEQHREECENVKCIVFEEKILTEEDALTSDLKYSLEKIQNDPSISNKEASFTHGNSESATNNDCQIDPEPKIKEEHTLGEENVDSVAKIRVTVEPLHQDQNVERREGSSTLNIESEILPEGSQEEEQVSLAPKTDLNTESSVDPNPQQRNRQRRRKRSKNLSGEFAMKNFNSNKRLRKNSDSDLPPLSDDSDVNPEENKNTNASTRITCIICSEVFFSKSSHNKHWKTHFRKNVGGEEINFKTRTKTRLRNNPGCLNCRGKKHDVGGLKCRLNVEGKIVPHKCSLCDRVFCYKKRLRDHMFFHFGFKCRAPGCTFASRKHFELKEHTEFSHPPDQVTCWKCLLKRRRSKKLGLKKCLKLRRTLVSHLKRVLASHSEQPNSNPQRSDDPNQSKRELPCNTCGRMMYSSLTAKRRRKMCRHCRNRKRNEMQAIKNEQDLKQTKKKREEMQSLEQEQKLE